MAASRGGRGLRGTSGNRSWLHPRLTFFMLPRVTVERALDISRGLRPRNSPIFPSTCTMYLATRKQRWQRHVQPRRTHSWVTFTPRPDAAYPSSVPADFSHGREAPSRTPEAIGPHPQTPFLAHFFL